MNAILFPAYGRKHELLYLKLFINSVQISDALHDALLIQSLDFSELALNGMLHEAVECVIACTYIVSVTIESLQH